MAAAESAPAGHMKALATLAITQPGNAANFDSIRDLKEKQSAHQFLTLPLHERTPSGGRSSPTSSQETPSLTK